MRNTLKILLNILLFTLLNSCQFNKQFFKYAFKQNSENKLKQSTLYKVNEDSIFVEQDNSNLSLNIYKNKIKLNNNHLIKPLDFVSKSGNKLSGFLLNPKNNNRTDLLFLHFHGSGLDLLTYHYPIISQLAENGFQIYTFDYSGFGFSEGIANRKNLLIDAYSALEFIKENQELKNKKIILFGQSYGGYLATIVASNNQSDIEGIIIEGAFYSPRKQAVYTAGFIANIVNEGIRAENEIKKNKKTILVIHSKEDETTPFEFGKKIFDNSNEPKYFMEIDKHHLLGLQFYGDSIKNKINNIFPFN